MTKDEALRLALDWLEKIAYVTAMDYEYQQWAREAITALKEALANEALDKMAENARELGLDYEPEQEPVAWAKFSAKGNIIDLLSEPDDDYTPLYTTPPQRTWVELTEDEMVSLRSRVQEYTTLDSVKYGEAIQRAMTQALKERNT